MDLYQYIWKRKATRKYDMTPLDEVQLNKIREFAANLKPLYPGVSVAYEVTNKVKSVLPLKAPHYFIISSDTAEGYLENIGFMFQQMDLYLSSLGLGSCWYGGGKKPEGIQTNLSFVIIMAFGRPVASPYRELAEFKRKSLSDISEGSDERIEAARVAPSAMNFQNWFFEAVNGKIHVYEKKTLWGSNNKLGKIDIGIAICHLYIATIHRGCEFAFVKENDIARKGYIYAGTVQ